MAQAAAQHPGNTYTNLPVGEILKRTRLHYNQSLDDVEKSLRIRAEQLEAIEEGQIEKLPGRVYAIGFVRSYSEYLGLDGNKMVELFKAQAASKATAPEHHFPIAASESKAPPVWLAALCVLLLVGIFIYWLDTRAQDRELVDNVPPVPETLKPDTISEAQSLTDAEEPLGPPSPQQNLETATPDNQTTAEANVSNEQSETDQQKSQATTSEAPPEGIKLSIKENTWVEIRDQGDKVLLSKVLKEGEQYFIPDREGLTMSIGNANGIEVTLGDITIESLGERGEVIRNMPLSAKTLRQRFQKSDQPQNLIDNSAQ